MERKLNQAFLFSGLLQLSPGRFKGRALINRRVSKAVHRAVLSWSRKVDRVHGAVAERVFDAIPNAKRGDLSTWGEARSKIIEKDSYAVFHQFSDALNARAFEVDRFFGGKSGLIREGMSVFRLSETRWLDSVLTQIALPAEIVSRLLPVENNDIPVHLLTSGATLEQMVKRIALKRGYEVVDVPYLGRPVANFIERLEERARFRQSFHYIVADWMRRTGNTAPQVANARVLFVAYKDRTLRRLAMMLNELREKFPLPGDIALLAITRNSDPIAQTTIERIAEQGVPVYYAAEILGQTAAEEILSEAKENLRVAGKQFLASVPPFEFEGIDISDFCSPLLSDVIQSGSLATALYAAAAQRAFESIRPKILVNFEEWDFNRAMSIVARRNNVPVVTHQLMSPAGWLGLVRRLSDVMAVSGTFLKSGYERTGLWPKQNIVVVGDPYADYTSGIQRLEARQALVSEFKLDPSLPVLGALLTFTDGILNPLHFTKFHAILAGLAGREFNLILRPHPQASLEETRREFEALGVSNPNFCGHLDLLEFSAGCDAMVSMPTSALTQVFLAGTPVVGLLPEEFRREYDQVYEWESGASVTVLDLSLVTADDLARAVGRFLNDSTFRKEKVESALRYVERHLGPIDGKSSKRMTHLLADLERPEGRTFLFKASEAVTAP